MASDRLVRKENMAAFAFRSSSSAHPYFVLMHTRHAPEDAIWNAYVRAISTTLDHTNQRVNVFVATEGGGPDAAQRRALAAAFERGDAMTYVFSTDMMVRGIVTAFRWIARARAVAHSPREFPEICARCQLEPEKVLSDFARLSQQMAPNDAHEAIRGSALPATRSLRPRAKASSRP